jgi:hypothetical protein
MSPHTAARVARHWTRLYTAGLPADVRDMRRAEVESDLWESLLDATGSRHILARLALGVVDDLTWSLTQMDTNTRASAKWSIGSLLVFAATWLWLANAPASITMRESYWAFPAALVLHVLGVVMFVGLRFALDLRLTGLALTTLPVSEMVSRLAPWTLLGGTVTAVSGMALYSAGFNHLAANPAFEMKIAALALALANAWFFHAVTCRRIAEWNERAVPPLAARVSGYVSLALWATIIAAGQLTGFMGN